MRFIPKPTGLRWLLSAHPLPLLIVLPPLSLALTLTSSLLAFAVISLVFRARPVKIKVKVESGKSSDSTSSRKKLGYSREEDAAEQRRREEVDAAEKTAVHGSRATEKAGESDQDTFEVASESSATVTGSEVGADKSKSD